MRPLRLAVLMVLALGSAWALVTPLGAVPDEPAHVIYAAAVVAGEAPQRWNDSVYVPGPVAMTPETLCTVHRRAVTADCIPPLDAPYGPVLATTTAAGYPPLYYGLVGWPILLGFGELTWYCMRLLSVLLGCALLWLGALAWDDSGRLAAVGLLVAMNPMAGFLLGAVNPNGAEIAAAVALTLAGCGLLRSAPEGIARWRAPTAVLISGGYLAVARPTSFVFVLALVGVLLVAGLPELARLPRRTPVIVLGVAVVALFSACLLVLAVNGDGSAPGAGARARGTWTWPYALGSVVVSSGQLLLDTAGLFGWADHRPPLLVSLLSVGLLIVVVVIGWARARLWRRMGIALLAVGALILGPFFAIQTVFIDGEGYQARYAMPLTQALPMLAAGLASPQVPQRRWGSDTRLLVLVSLLVLAVHVLDLGGTWLRFGVGLPLVLDTDLSAVVQWIPPLWPLALLLMAVAVAAAVAMTRIAHVPTRRSSAQTTRT